MRRRKRNKSIIFILILFISIGFAALTANLSINSGITFLPQSFHVYFDNVVVNQNSVNQDLPTISNNDQQVSFTTTINEPGDFYEFSFDVINDGTMDAALTEIVKSGLTETQEKYLNYTARYYGERDIKVDDILHAGYIEKVIVRVEYKYDVDEVVSLGNITFNFGLNYIKRDLQKDYGEETWSYRSTNSVKTLNVPKAGLYKLETWGSQGAGAYYGTPGYGGYSTGIINLAKNENLFVAVGGRSNWNGGGKSSVSIGGDATHISYKNSRGILKNYENNIEELLIVAGGGGGAENTGTGKFGGSGGGYIGNSGNATYYPSNGTGGTQTLGGIGSTYYTTDHPASENLDGSFGQGGSGKSTRDSGPGGGGGLYGGGASTFAGGGGGGSGYIGNTNLTNKIMYCYNCQESTAEADETHIKTRSTTNVSNEPISYYAKKGLGFARITYIGNYNPNQYTVINYHPNGGQGSMETQVINSNTSLKENKYTRDGYTFVGWSTTEKELPNIFLKVTYKSNFINNGDNSYTYDYSINNMDTYLQNSFTEDLVKGTNYTFMFNVKNGTFILDNAFGYPDQQVNNYIIKNGLNIIKFNNWTSAATTKAEGVLDDSNRLSSDTSSATLYNFFLYKDSEVDYLDKANITYNSNTKTINLYALWAKVES